MNLFMCMYCNRGKYYTTTYSSYYKPMANVSFIFSKEQRQKVKNTYLLQISEISEIKLLRPHFMNETKPISMCFMNFYDGYNCLRGLFLLNFFFTISFLA